MESESISGQSVRASVKCPDDDSKQAVVLSVHFPIHAPSLPRGPSLSDLDRILSDAREYLLRLSKHSYSSISLSVTVDASDRIVKAVTPVEWVR